MKKNLIWLTLSILLAAILLLACSPAANTIPASTAVQTTAANTTPASTTTQTPGATSTPATEAKVTGSVTYREKIALPTGAVVQVKLLDVSKQDAPAVTIGEQVITTTGNQVPFSFEIKYNPTAVDPRYSYSVRASITVEGKLWFTSDTSYPVITRGNPSTVEMILKKVAEPTSASASALENTNWVLESYGQPGTLKSVLKDAEITAVFDSAKGQVGGSAGVNRYFGSYKLDGSKLTMTGPMGSTMMAGPQPLMDQETEYLKAIQVAESYKIEGSQLTITCGSKVLIFRKK